MTTTLKDIRESKGLTQDEVAKEAGITKSYYSMIETGKRGTKGVNYHLAIRIASAFDLKPDDIFLNK